jgi:hypothetical protein
MWRNRIAAPMSMDPLSADSRCLFHADCAQTRIDAETGGLVAITEHVGAFSRGGNTLTATDMDGVTYSAPPSMPAWESRSWPIPGDLSPQPAFGLLMGEHDRVAFAVQFPWQPHRGMHAMIETGAAAVEGATLLSITNDTMTGPAMWIAAVGGVYTMTVTDGASTITAAVPGAAPAAGQRVTFDWRLTNEGFLEFAQTIGGSASRQRAMSSEPIMFSSSASGPFSQDFSGAFGTGLPTPVETNADPTLAMHINCTSTRAALAQIRDNSGGA